MLFCEAIQSKMKWVRLFWNGLHADVETIQTTSNRFIQLRIRPSTKRGTIRSDNKCSSALWQNG